jgi:hypothetical protein
VGGVEVDKSLDAAVLRERCWFDYQLLQMILHQKYFFFFDKRTLIRGTLGDVFSNRTYAKLSD